MGQSFPGVFDDKGVLKFTKTLDLMEFKENPIDIKQIAYR